MKKKKNDKQQNDREKASLVLLATLLETKTETKHIDNGQDEA